VLGSADSLLVGVSTLGYPSGHADPLVSAFSGESESTSGAEATTTSETEAQQRDAARQPPAVAETAAAAPLESYASSVEKQPVRYQVRMCVYRTRVEYGQAVIEVCSVRASLSAVAPPEGGRGQASPYGCTER